MSIFDIIILLSGQAEQPVLAAALLNFNPLLTIQSAAALPDLLALDAEILQRARLVAFSTSVIVPAAILRQLGFGAYNFHPGSPEFPGWAPAFFALHKGATHFGATVHVMTERIDAGPIVGIEMFRIPQGITSAGLEGLSYGHLARLFWRLAGPLAIQREPVPVLPLQWGEIPASRRLFKSLLCLPPDISDAGLIETMRARIG